MLNDDGEKKYPFVVLADIVYPITIFSWIEMWNEVTR